MAGPSFNVKSPTIKRILQESRELSANPDPHITASPLETNLFEWHFTITGPPSTPYADGIYHGRIVLPSQYPLRPPAFRFLTPSGRFETNREICLSISGHHEETWQPAWGIRTALCAIRAFMAGEANGQVGGLDAHPAAREKLARESRAWKCAVCGCVNDEVIRECEQRWKAAGAAAKPDDDVPEELRLAFREDLGKKEDEQQGDNKSKEEKEAPADVKVPAPATEGSLAVEAAAAPTGARPAVRQRAAFAAPAQSNSPAWLDRAIVGIALALLLMLIKRLVTFTDY